MHAEDDLDIPVWHAQKLFDAFLEKHLPPLPEELTSVDSDDSNNMMDVIVAPDQAQNDVLLAESVAARAARRRELVRVSEMERVGRVEVFAEDRKDGEVVFLHTRWGAHDVGLVEGVQDFMAEMFDMGTSARK